MHTRRILYLPGHRSGFLYRPSSFSEFQSGKSNEEDTCNNKVFSQVAKLDVSSVAVNDCVNPILLTLHVVTMFFFVSVLCLLKCSERIPSESLKLFTSYFIIQIRFLKLSFKQQTGEFDINFFPDSVNEIGHC